MGEKRLDIKTGFICNNNCRFCVQAHNKFKGNRSFEDIKKDLIDSRKRCDGIVLTGGEVTIRKDFFDIIKLARDLGYKTIQIQTNGRMFSSLDFCKKTIKAGATEFSPALHGYCARQHDYLTRSSGSFKQTVQGIKNLKLLGGFILTNTVVVKQNYRNIPEIANLFVKLNVDQFQFAFVHPIGNALKNFDKVVPKISLAAPYIKKGLQIGIDAGKRAMVEAVPYCLMKGYEDYVSEQYIPETEIAYGNNVFTEDYKKVRIKEGKAKFKQCKSCDFNKICEGPWKEYPEKFGSNEFSPKIKMYNKLGLSYIKKIKKRGINVSEGWVNGVNLESYLNLYPQQTKVIYRKAAQLLSKIHHKEVISISKEESKKTVKNIINYSLRIFKKQLKENKIYDKTKNILLQKFPKEFIPDLIHGDLWLKNIIIKENKLFLIDFDCVHISFLENDLLHFFFNKQYNYFFEEYKKQNNRTKKAHHNLVCNRLFYEIFYLLTTQNITKLKKLLK